MKVNIWFTLDSLDHLRLGGRLSAASATLGALLDIKTLLFVDNNGKLVPVKKARGRKKAIKGLLEEFQNRVINPEEQTIFINHGDCIEDAEYLKKLVMNEGKVKDEVINYVGPVIGAHTGPGILCIAYIGISR